MTLLFIDSETIGTNGGVMRFQYAVDDGPIKFVDYPFNRAKLEELFGLLYDPQVLFVAYFASFDVYHAYRMLHQYWHGRPLDSHDRPTKPFTCRVLDLQIPAMLHGPFKNFAFAKGKSRSVARVRRIPRVAADLVRDRVMQAIRPHVPSEFQILVGEHECKGQPDLVTLSFSVDGRASLKAHARHYGAPTLSLPDLWPLPPKEIEKPWLPYYEEADYEDYKREALRIMADPRAPFATYCRLDILFLKLLADEMLRATGKTRVEELIDHHSDCVAAVAYTRYHGFEVDRSVLERTKQFYAAKVEAAQAAIGDTDLKSAPQRLALLRSVDPLVAASNRKVLEVLAKSDRPSAPVAKAMLDFGMYRQRLLQVEKVLECRTGRAHPDLRVMGTATGRMAGTSGLNWQGIAQAQKNSKGELVGIRAAMKCGFGGDFEALEVTIAAAAYADKQLQADLDAGVDLHSMSASMIPAVVKLGYTYEQIRDGYLAHDPVMVGWRKRGKSGVFSTLYGAQAQKISEVLGCTEGEADGYQRNFFKRYSGIGRYRAEAVKNICSADTERWSKDSVSLMQRAVLDLLGYERRFDFESQVADALWRLGSGGLVTGRQGMVTRTKEKGAQTLDNAVKSGLLGGAIAIQQAVSRQVCNSPVQSMGANLTKILMARLWNEFRVPIFQCHDEVLIPSRDIEHTQIRRIQNDFLTKYRSLVPSLNINIIALDRWSDK